MFCETELTELAAVLTRIDGLSTDHKIRALSVLSCTTQALKKLNANDPTNAATVATTAMEPEGGSSTTA